MAREDDVESAPVVKYLPRVARQPRGGNFVAIAAAICVLTVWVSSFPFRATLGFAAVVMIGVGFWGYLLCKLLWGNARKARIMVSGWQLVILSMCALTGLVSAYTHWPHLIRLSLSRKALDSYRKSPSSTWAPPPRWVGLYYVEKTQNDNDGFIIKVWTPLPIFDSGGFLYSPNDDQWVPYEF